MAGTHSNASPEPQLDTFTAPRRGRGKSDLARLLARLRVVVADPRMGACWEWTGVRNESGYGYLTITTDLYRYRKVRVHRLSYMHFVGPIPEGLVIDHRCRNPACINPDHLEAVTSAENQSRGNQRHMAARSRCHAGHPFVVGSFRISVRKGGRHRVRVCIPCERERYRRRITRTQEEHRHA